MSSNATNKNDRILILDDEPQYLEWLREYLVSQKRYNIEIVSDLRAALEAITAHRFRFLVLDLSVPVAEELKPQIASQGAVYAQFPGLYAAHHARNLGYRSRQVIVYSVHDSDAIREISSRIGIQYIMKGRPAVFKQEIDSVLSYDPSRRKP